MKSTTNRKWLIVLGRRSDGQNGNCRWLWDLFIFRRHLTGDVDKRQGLHRRGRFTVLRQVPQAERSLFCAG